MRIVTKYDFPLNQPSSNSMAYQVGDFIVAQNSKGKTLAGVIKKRKGYIKDDNYYTVEDTNGQNWDVPLRLIKWTLECTNDTFNDFINEVNVSSFNSVQEYRNLYFKLHTLKRASYKVGDYVFVQQVNDYGIVKSIGCSSDYLTAEYVVMTIHNGDKIVKETTVNKATYEDYKRQYDNMNFQQQYEHIGNLQYQLEQLGARVDYLTSESINVRKDLGDITINADNSVQLSDNCCIPKLDVLDEKFKKHEKRVKLLTALGAAFL